MRTVHGMSQGRVDLLLIGLGKAMCASVAAQTGFDFWPNGGELLVQRFIERANIPTEPINIGKSIVNNLIPAKKTKRVGRAA